MIFRNNVYFMRMWEIAENAFDPKQLREQETVYSIGNGYLGTRGAFEEGYPGELASTLISGLFDDAPVVHTELANTPNWIDMQLLLGGERFRMDRGIVSSYERKLYLRSGLLTRTVRWARQGGGQFEITFERFASLADEHVLGLRCRLRSVDFSGNLEVQSGLPGYAENEGMLHWEWRDQGSIAEHSAFLHLATRGSHIPLAEAFSLTVQSSQKTYYDYWDSKMAPVIVAGTSIAPGQEVTIEKLVAVYTGRESENPQTSAKERIVRAELEGFDHLLSASAAAWQQDWQACNVEIEGDEQADLALRYSLYGLLFTAPRHDLKASIPAKSLAGFGYRGHVFWDTDIFALPFLTYTRPNIARNLLMYRYHTLPGARQKARENGFEGAMYAWESAGDGSEVTPRWVGAADTGELIRIWPGDIELHISADVAYAVIQYWHVSGDDEFMHAFGAEIVFETARFWGSRAQWNEAGQRYDINDVIGPDENHEHVNNNAYTNGIARWNLKTALDLLDWLNKTDPEKARGLTDSLDLSPKRLAHWQDVIKKITLGYDAGTHLFEQFEGYFKLKPDPVKAFEPRTRSLQSILGVVGCQQYQVIKQPDAMMLFYLLGGTDPLFDEENLRANWNYYTPLTDLAFGSSLGPGTQAGLAARMNDIHSAYHYFLQAAKVDLGNLRGNTHDGLHSATQGGAWQAAILGMAGLKIEDGRVSTHAQLPSAWKRLKFRVEVRGSKYEFDLPNETGGDFADAAAQVRGAIFDLDGVLTDTSEMHYQAWQRLADEEGIPFNRQDNEALRGVPRRESLLLMLKGRQVSEERLQEMMDRKNRYYVEFIKRITPKNLLPGALDLLTELHHLGIPTAIASASMNAPMVVDLLEIRPLISVLVDGSSVKRQKPAPDLFLLAANLLKLPPRECVVFEDAKAGVEAALAGEMLAVGIGPRERVGMAHVVVTGLEGMHWQHLVHKLEESRTHSSRPVSSLGMTSAS